MSDYQYPWGSFKPEAKNIGPTNKAKEILTPKKGVARIVFLYVGQGEATLIFSPEGESHKTILIDSNKSDKNGAILLHNLLSDYFKNTNQKIDVFINTHPHNDHILGIEEIHENVGINEIWHSGHKPGKDDADAYQKMMNVVSKIGKDKEFRLFGSDQKNKIRKRDGEETLIKNIGSMNYQVLAPAEYVVDDIEGETADGRKSRIHEHCGVIYFEYGNPNVRVMITGDSDKKAWKEHIFEHHKGVLPSKVLSASHHGSRTFFKENEEDKEPFKEHLSKISPTYLIISAPKDSPHDHPHTDALEIYKEVIKENCIMKMSDGNKSFIFDIPLTGSPNLFDDSGELSEFYCKNGNSDEGNKYTPSIGVSSTRLDNKPHG